MAFSYDKNRSPRGHAIYNFGDSFLVHNYYIHSMSDLCLGIEKKILEEIIHFHYVTYMKIPTTLDSYLSTVKGPSFGL